MIRTQERRAGLSLLEVTAATTLLTLFLVTVGFSVHSSALSAREVQRNFAAQRIGQHWIDQLVMLDFGSMTDPPPSRAELDEFFDGDAEPGTITVLQLHQVPDVRGWTVPLPDSTSTLRFQVDFDIDDSDAGADIQRLGLRKIVDLDTQVDPIADEIDGTTTPRLLSSSLASFRSKSSMAGISTDIALPTSNTTTAAFADSSTTTVLEASQRIVRVRVFLDDDVILTTSRALEAE
jgi:hypothetical protein